MLLVTAKWCPPDDFEVKHPGIEVKKEWWPSIDTETHKSTNENIIFKLITYTNYVQKEYSILISSNFFGNKITYVRRTGQFSAKNNKSLYTNDG